MTPAARELLLDDELLDRAGVAAPRLGPVRHHVAGLDELRRAAPSASRSLMLLGERAHLVADRLGLGRQVDGLGPASRPSRVRSVTSARGLVGVEQRQRARWPGAGRGGRRAPT